MRGDPANNGRASEIVPNLAREWRLGIGADQRDGPPPPMRGIAARWRPPARSRRMARVSHTNDATSS